MPHRVNSIDFQTEANGHRFGLAQRGFKEINQACLDNHLVNNAPWKTYWLAEHPEFGDVFVKINYGYDSKTNFLMGVKEAKLPAYFSTYFPDMSDVIFPEVLDHWNMGSAYAVTFKREQITNQSIFSLITTPKYREILYGILRTWSTIQPPIWWNEKFVLHDFAFHNDLQDIPNALSPFGFDFDDNLGVNLEGKLFIYDFEFIQWTTSGLQQLFLVHKLFSSRRQFFETLHGRGLAKDLLELLNGGIENSARKQASRAFNAKLVRDEVSSLESWLLQHAADLFIKWNCH